MDTQRIGKCLAKLQEFYKQQLSPDLQEEFIGFCLDNFRGIAQVEKAVSLLIQHEPNYGRIPNFQRMVVLLQESMQTKHAIYQAPSSEILALPSAQERGVDRSKWTPLTAQEIDIARWGAKNSTIERLKCKVYVCQFFIGYAALPHGSRIMREAIEEATARRIPLDLIGLTERAIA